VILGRYIHMYGNSRNLEQTVGKNKITPTKKIELGRK
jgi:hypothetical protein